MNLTPDTLYSVALELDGGELMKMCSTNNETRRICTSERFNPIWTQKLLKEFNVRYQGNNAYMEYLQHAYLYKQSCWIATISSRKSTVSITKIFKNKSDAAAFLANEAMKYHWSNQDANKPKYFVYIAALNEGGEFKDKWNKYKLVRSDFETTAQESENYNNYNSSLTNLYNLLVSSGSLEDDQADFKRRFESMISAISEGGERRIDGENIWRNFEGEFGPLRGAGEIKNALLKIINMKNVYEEE